MKQLFFTVLLFLPLTCFAQKKETWWSRGREEQKAESAAYRRPQKFKNSLDEGGFHLQRAGSFLVGGTICELLGAGVIIGGNSSDRNGDAAIIGGGIMAGAGLILQIVGYSQLIQSGKIIRGVAFTGKGVSITL